MHIYRIPELEGNKNVLSVLNRELKLRKLKNLVIYHGVLGTGKSSAAEATVLSYICENPNEGNACLECKSCRDQVRRFRNKESSYNVVKKNIPELKYDKSKKSLMELIREMFELLQSTTDQTFYILEEVQDLPLEDQSIFLEYINGMSANMYIIMTTTKIQSLDPALVSRARCYPFKRLTDLESKALAIRTGRSMQTELAPELVNAIVKNSRGVARDIVNSVEQVVNVGITLEELLELMGQISNKVFINLLLAMKDTTVSFMSVVDDLTNKHTSYDIYNYFQAFLLSLITFEETKDSKHMDAVEAKAGLSVVSGEKLTKMLYDSAKLGWRVTDTELKIFFLKWKRIINSTGMTPVLSNLEEASKDLYKSTEARRLEKELTSTMKSEEVTLDLKQLKAFSERRKDTNESQGKGNN